ncbi:MAG TPA: BamA/TamA family outer membrane protein [Gemmatimonadales bacterium]|nr:BamA/TamA family outer membrane protein [Gemmatimonadales bacterium]
MRVTRLRRLLPLLILLVGLSARLHAQEEEREPGTPWRLSYFPYLSGGANDGPVITARLRYWQPAEYEDRVTANAALDAAAGLTFRGSRFVGAKFTAPQMVEGWRFFVGAIADRQVRFGYFGLGNDTEKDDDLVTESVPFLYRMRRTRYEGIVEATRRLRGPLQLSLQGDFESVRFTSLPGPSVFTADFGEELAQDDAAGRIALVYDTRDIEYNTKQGLLLEAGAQVGSGGDGYTRLYSVLRGYLQVREGTVVALRLAGSGMGGTPTLNARFDLPAWEHHMAVLGGEQSHRSLDTGRLAGRGTLFGNLEVRHDLLPFGDLGAVTLLAFVDAGRVFEQESFRLTTDDMAVGGGGGVALRILRSTIFTFNFAGGPDGFNFEVGSGWMF